MKTANFSHYRIHEYSDRFTQTKSGIGIATVPRQRIEVTQDAARVQAALLAKPRSPDFWPVAVGAACAVGLVVMHFAGWLPGGGA